VADAPSDEDIGLTALGAADADTPSSSSSPPEDPRGIDVYEITTTSDLVNSGNGWTLDVGLLCSPPFARVAAKGRNVKAGQTVHRSKPTRIAVLILATLLDTGTPWRWDERRG
jgi:hypothetical protein